MAVISAIDRVKILVLGDSGAGKTSFVHLSAHNESLRSPSWTVGCSVEVKLHEYKEGTRDQKPFFVEFWDVGGSHFHRNTRSVFYNMCHGAILVYDLTNRKSETNLSKWVNEICKREKNESNSSNSIPSVQALLSDCVDQESIFGNFSMPFLVIGTKLDQIDYKKPYVGYMANQLGAEEILLDCFQTRYLAAGTSNAVKLSRFYDKVIEHRFNSTKISCTERFIPNPLYTKFFSTHQE